MECSPPGSSVCGILQERILEWVAIALFVLSIIVLLVISFKKWSTYVISRENREGKYDPHFWLSIWLQHGEGNGNSLQYSCLENPIDGGAWWAAVHGVAKSRTRLSDFTFTFHFHALEKEMATHSSVLAWRIPGMGEPSGKDSELTSFHGHTKITTI